MSQTLFSRISPDQMDDSQRAAWQQLNDLTGEPTFIEVFAQAPELLNFVMGGFYQDIFFGGRVPGRFKQLLRLRLSFLNGCRTCNLQNVPGTRDAGYSDAQIEAIRAGDGDALPPPDRAVLAFADLLAIANVDQRLSAEQYAALAEHFSDAEICELGVVGSVIAGMAKLSFVMNLVEQESYCAFGGSA